MVIARSSPSGPNAATYLRGTNLTVDADGKLSPVTRPRRLFDWEYFNTGGVATGQIGRMGWSLLGVGTPAYARLNGSLASGAKGALSTSNVANDRSTLCLGDLETRLLINPLESITQQFVWTMAGSLVTKRAVCGFTSTFAANPLTTSSNALCLVYDSSVSPNYQLVNRFGTTTVEITDTGIVVPADTPQLISFVQSLETPALFSIYIGSGSQQSVLVDEVTLANTAGYNANVGFSVSTLGAVVSTVNVGYWGMNSNLLTDVYGDDNFLEH